MQIAMVECLFNKSKAFGLISGTIKKNNVIESRTRSEWAGAKWKIEYHCQ